MNSQCIFRGTDDVNGRQKVDDKAGKENKVRVTSGGADIKRSRTTRWDLWDFSGMFGTNQRRLASAAVLLCHLPLRRIPEAN